MKRSHGLLLLVAVFFVAAVGLRIRSQLTRRDMSPVPAGVRFPSASLPMPHDYVADPLVSPDETDHGPRRMVSLAPSITEMACAMGLRDRLIGRTQYCRYPPEVQSVPVVGALMDTNYAKIKSLAPDLILTTSNSGPVTDNLHKLGLRYDAVPHGSLEDVYVGLERMGRLCNRPKTAHRLIRAIRSDVDSLRRSAGASNVKPLRVLVVLGGLPVPPKAVFVAGPGSFLDAMVRLAGHTNAAAGVLKTPHGEIPLEKLRAVDPDVILAFSSGSLTPADWAELYQSWSEVGTLKAIQQRRVRLLGGPEWLSAGPRIAICLHRFITVLSEFQ